MGLSVLAQIVIYMYNQTTVPSRFAYIFWSMFILIYLYTALHEKLHGLSFKATREYKRWNYPWTLYVLGAACIAVHHLTLDSGLNKIIWSHASRLGFFGFVIMAGGLALVCVGRASINGYWTTNIYDYGSNNRLVTGGAYQKTRHPIYDGQFLMACGTVLMANNWWVIFFPILILAVNIWRAKREDKDLSERFGDKFVDYKNRTPFFMFSIA